MLSLDTKPRKPRKDFENIGYLSHNYLNKLLLFQLSQIAI